MFDAETYRENCEELQFQLQSTVGVNGYLVYVGDIQITDKCVQGVRQCYST